MLPTCAAGGGTSRTLCGHSECVARIDPATGTVRGWIDFTSLLEHEPSRVREDIENSVFNGIAYDDASDRLLVTGKNWQSIYRVAIRPTDNAADHVRSVCNLAA